MLTWLSSLAGTRPMVSAAALPARILLSFLVVGIWIKTLLWLGVIVLPGGVLLLPVLYAVGRRDSSAAPGRLEAARRLEAAGSARGALALRRLRQRPEPLRTEPSRTEPSAG